MLELEANEATGYEMENEENLSEQQGPPVSWHITFLDQRQQIIELWDACQVSIIHRTQFYLLFKGDEADQIYMEVELRRLTWLQQHFAELGNASPAPQGDNKLPISLSGRYVTNQILLVIILLTLQFCHLHSLFSLLAALKH